ncbi:MAG: hypothetical protein LBS62_14365 [Clostridiales bacterium]|jgi:hypothetical protein|nr:hypothetical protein [Clostridiales bacterium]
MEYCENWDKIQERHRAFWNKELSGPCLFSVTAPRDGAVYESFPLPDRAEDRTHYWTDAEQVIKRHRSHFSNTYYAGDAFPVLVHDLGPAGHAGFFEGARFRFEGTVWFDATLKAYEDLRFDPSSFLYNKTLELAREYARDAQGAYIVSMPDTVGAADALTHLRGPDQFMFDLLDSPDEVKGALVTVQAVWEQVMRGVYDAVAENNYGGTSVGWLSTWAPGLHGQLQCDLSLMLSPDMFEEFLLYELEAQSRFLDHALYHLDGRQQVIHLPHLLAIESIEAVQWTNVAGQAPVVDFIPVLQSIQQAGKNLILDCSPAELPVLLENLSASQMYVRTWADSRAEADSLVEMVRRF